MTEGRRGQANAGAPRRGRASTTNLRLSTVDGVVPIDFTDDEDMPTLPIDIPPGISPEVLRMLTDVQAATVSRTADYLESIGRGRNVLIGTHDASALVRSMRALMPRSG